MIPGASSSPVFPGRLRHGQAIESAKTSAQTEHVDKLSPAHLSKKTLDAFKETSPDMIQSAITHMAANAIADGTLNLYSTEHNEATFKLLLRQGNTSPGELLVHARKNEQQRYDIFELKHKSYASGPTETVVLMERSKEANRSTEPHHAAKEKSKKLNLLFSKPGVESRRQDLPRLSEYAREQIEKIDEQFVGRKLDKQDVRKQYQRLVQENQQLPAAGKKSEPELWRSAINDAKFLERSALSARHQMALRQGKGPLEAKAMAALSALYTPIGMARKALKSKQEKVDQQEQDTRRKLDALPPQRTAGIGASRPKRSSLDSLALTDMSLETVNRASDTRLSRVEPGEPDDPAIKAGAEAYQALSPKTRAALDAILELVDKHGEAAFSDLSEEARHSLGEYRDLSFRLSLIDADGGESNDWTSNPVPTP